jgi:hypothetical protein
MRKQRCSKMRIMAKCYTFESDLAGLRLQSKTLRITDRLQSIKPSKDQCYIKSSPHLYTPSTRSLTYHPKHPLALLIFTPTGI